MQIEFSYQTFIVNMWYSYVIMYTCARNIRNILLYEGVCFYHSGVCYNTGDVFGTMHSVEEASSFNTIYQ